MPRASEFSSDYDKAYSAWSRRAKKYHKLAQRRDQITDQTLKSEISAKMKEIKESAKPFADYMLSVDCSMSCPSFDGIETHRAFCLDDNCPCHEM